MVLLHKVLPLSFRNAWISSTSARSMAKSVFEYVKDFELDDRILPNAWPVIRLDGKCFHTFAEKHGFTKPNDERALRLMNRAALSVLEEFQEVLLAYGQSDEYSFVLKKNTDWYNRRSAKILTTIDSKFTASYVYYWKQFFGDEELKYPPSFDGRLVLYPADKNLIDYLRWRQADVHVNNLYNTTFWNLVLKANMTPQEAEQKLSGTVSSDKNEILFSQFNINYNNEPVMFKRGTILLRKLVKNVDSDKMRTVVVDIHDDMLKHKFWTDNPELLLCEKPVKYDGPLTDLIRHQLDKKRLKGKVEIFSINK